MQPIIQAKNLVKSYAAGQSRLTVLKNLEFSVSAGEFVSITGKSGSGKSTLLYQLGLLDRPDSGEIIIGNTTVSGMSEGNRTNIRLNNFGYVFQDYALIPDLDSVENVMLPLLMLGISMPEAKIKAMQALEKVGLGEKKYSKPNQLSGGQQQRVSIARAIAHDPQIIFADEPTANLDTETSKIVLNIFLELNKGGQTIVMVTHEPEYARLAHRTVLLSDGKIISDIINTRQVG